MKARMKTRSETNGGGENESVRGDGNDTLPSRTITTNRSSRSVARQACIGDMEEELHHAFAMARVPGGTDFVYERDHDAYARLDEFCSWNQMSEPAAPLVVFGPSGSGKSALLANWLLHYRRRLEQRPQHGGPLEEPFVFCHAVGCTRHGVDVDQLLWRLLGDLKQKFDLGRNVPNEAERLSWELPRFLEMAGRKGRVIIVIDGLHRVQDKNGGETGLQWLPLRFPGNVRVVVTATNPDPSYVQLHEQRAQQVMAGPYKTPAHQVSNLGSSGGSIAGGGGGGGSGSRAAEITAGDAEYESSHRRRKVLMELQRRKWPTLEVGPLEGWRKRDIVEAFLKRSLTGTSEPTESSALRPTNVNSATPGSSGGDGGATAQISKTFLTGVDFVVDAGITGNTMHLHSGGEAQCGDCGGGGGGGEGGGGGDADGGSGKIPGGHFKICDKPGLVLFPSMVERIVSR